MNFKFELKKSYFVVVEKNDNSHYGKSVDFNELLKMFHEFNLVNNISRIIVFPEELIVD